jgi:hypothetical protein
MLPWTLSYKTPSLSWIFLTSRSPHTGQAGHKLTCGLHGTEILQVLCGPCSGHMEEGECREWEANSVPKRYHVLAPVIPWPPHPRGKEVLLTACTTSAGRTSPGRASQQSRVAFYCGIMELGLVWHKHAWGQSTSQPKPGHPADPPG